MSFWDLLKDKIEEFEKHNKGKWFTYRGRIVKFDALVFGPDGDVKAKFKTYDFLDSIEYIEYEYVDFRQMYQAQEVSIEYVEKQIKDSAMVKLYI